MTTQCLNPNCLAVNAETHRFCQKCGQKLWLKDRYQALKLIGQGGFGKIFLAIDHDIPRKPRCVIKQFSPPKFQLYWPILSLKINVNIWYKNILKGKTESRS
jgi:serine/threonine protein kinase